MPTPLGALYNAGGLQSVGLTFDVDWAPDFAVAALVDKLRRRGARATIFATQPLAALAAVAGADDIEVALHPSFLPGSSHGATPDEVMTRLRGWFPDAAGVRMHSLVQSSPLLAHLGRLGVRYDSSLLLYDHPYAQAFDTVFGLRRIPYVWADASHLFLGRPMALSALHLETPGLKVLNFHPLLVALDAESPARYAALKAAWPDLPTAPRGVVAANAGGPGVGTLLEALLDKIEMRGLTTYTLSELCDAVDAHQGSAGRAAPFDFA